MDSLPWDRINDYVLRIETARSAETLHREAVTGLASVIPCDNAASFDDKGDAIFWADGTIDKAWGKAFNEYYRYRFPIDFENLRFQCMLDFRRWSETEYYRDFIKPIGIRFSLGVYGAGPVQLSASRASVAFSDAETRTLEILNSHLNNLYLHFTAPETGLDPFLQVFTRREREVLDQLRQGMTASESADILGVSRRTVEKHLANMYQKAEVRGKRALLEKAGFRLARGIT